MRPLIPRGGIALIFHSCLITSIRLYLEPTFQQHEPLQAIVMNADDITPNSCDEVLALLRIISNAVFAAITEWTDGVSCPRNRRFAIFGILDGIFWNTGCTASVTVLSQCNARDLAVILL